MVLLGVNRNLVRLSFRCFRNCHVNCTSNTAIEDSVSTAPVKEEVPKTRLLKVALLGRPNAGKSTIINRLVSRTICPTSFKVHTTKHNAKAMFTQGEAQVVFIDTPGALSPSEMKKYNAPGNNNIVTCALREADMVGLVGDISDIFNRNKIQSYMLKLAEKLRPDATLILIFNKVDTLRNKGVLLDLARYYKTGKNMPKFEDIFMISALDGSGIDDLKNYLVDSAPPGKWEYPVDGYTDQEPIALIEETVRAKFMDGLPHEIPYRITVKVAHIDMRADGSMVCLVNVICPTLRIQRLILKLGGKRVKTLSQLIEADLRNAFQNAVSVMINVKALPVT